MHGLSTTARDERGFTLPAVIIGMFIAGLITVALFTGILIDIPSARSDQDRQRASEVARAGLSWYGFELSADQDYWTTCADNGSADVPVNLKGSTTNKRTFGGDGTYALQLIPADGQTACISKTAATTSASPGTSMLQDNTLRILSVGTARGKTRKFLGTYKRKSFLDFVYYTNYETLDPAAYGATLNVPSIAGQCKNYWPQRNLLTISGLVSFSSSKCVEINFISADVIRGPFHTEDTIHLNGSPTIGRAGDPVEIVHTGNASATVGTGSVIYGGTAVASPTPVQPPPDNTTLQKLASPSWTFSGRTVISMSGSTITVNGVAKTGWPPNGVIYVKNSTTVGCTGYANGQDYDTPGIAGCGNAWVSGNYGKSLTIGAQNDVIVAGNVTKTSGSDALLGLIANQFVRVFNPTGGNPAPSGITSAHPTTIEAGILAVNHSFIVDNYNAGSPQGSLNVTGAIAQNFRGPVGTGSGTTVSTGYKKNYVYDDRFKYREPPNFVSPVDSAWNLIRVTEQTGGT